MKIILTVALFIAGYFGPLWVGDKFRPGFFAAYTRARGLRRFSIWRDYPVPLLFQVVGLCVAMVIIQWI